jgi:hypothetical protein
MPLGKPSFLSRCENAAVIGCQLRRRLLFVTPKCNVFDGGARTICNIADGAHCAGDMPDWLRAVRAETDWVGI